MIKHLFLSFPGIGAVAIIPFSLLNSKENKISSNSEQNPLIDSSRKEDMNLASMSPSRPGKPESNPVVARGGHSTQ